MKAICIYALVVTCLIVKGYSEPIQCYECDNCKDLNDDMLQPCPPDATTPSPSSDEDSSSASETSSSTDASTSISTETEKANDVPAEEDHKARNYKSVMTKTSTNNIVSYQCFSIVKAGSEDQQVRKGCIEVPANREGCDVLKEEEGVSEENCKVCLESKCNSSVALKYSIVAVFLVSVMKAFF